MSKQRIEKQDDARVPKEKVIFRTLSWQLKEENESGTGGTTSKRGYRERTKTNILVSGRTLDKTEDGKNKSISIEITGVQLWIYIEFPSGFTKNKNNIEFFKDWLKEQLRPNEPKRFEFCKDAILLDGRRKTDLLKVYYDSINGIWGTKNRLKPSERSKMVIIGDKEYKKEDFKIHEDRVDHIVKFGKKLNIDFSGYASVPRKYLDESGDNSRCDYFARVALDDFKPEKEPDDPPNIYYMLIDNEQYSRYHDSTFPDPQDKKNVIFQIGVLYGIVGQEKPLQKYLITMYDPHDIDDVIIIRVKTEKEVLLARYSLEGELDPDIIQHFNGLNYDLPTDFIRGGKAKIVESLRKLCSRSIHEPAEINKVSWFSKAYGKNKYSFIDAGRVQLDVKIEVERNHKLPSYSLKAVAEKFLNENKDDITPRQLFIFFKITQDFYQKAKELKELYGDNEVPYDTRVEIKEKIKEIFPLRYSNKLTKKCRDELVFNWGTGNEFFHAVRTPLTLTGKYCVQDCNVTNKLAEKLNTWEGFLQLSSIMKVPVSYLQGKGQLVKVVAQIYSKCVDEGIVINSFPEKEIVDYQGAYVVDGQPGYYKNVFVEDFFSLYPTNIIAGCMDYTTYDEHHKLPEGEYMEFKWESHENCIHGHKKVNKQKKTICGNFCHRFKKIRFDEDGNPIGEGILPAVLREGLKARVDIKFEEAVYDVAVRDHEGRLENPESDLKFYKANCGKFNVVYNDKKGGLPKHLHERYKRRKITLNARQLAVKTGLNSAYGGTGAQRGPIPHVAIAASITYLARVMINEVINYALREYGKLGLFLVYGDTDSCMLCVDYMGLKEAIEFADKFARDATHMIKCFIMGLKMDYKVTAPDGKKYTLRPEKEGGFPRKWVKELEAEERNNVYWYDYIPTKLNFEKFNEDFLFLSKKRYIANVVNNKGVKIDRVKKGCVLTRRDNPYWTRYHYQNISDMIMKGEDQKLIMDYIVDAINDLWTNIHLDFKTGKKIPYEHFIIYMGVKDLVQYAKKKNGCFVDADGNIFNPRKLDDGEFDPSDERLVYNKLKQVFLIKKINSRGTKVPSSTRLEFLYIEDANAESDSQKAEDYLYFKEKRLEENMKVDKMYYLEKQFTNPITELVSTRYRGKAIPYEDPDVKFDRLLKKIHNKQRFETTKNTLRTYVSILKNKKQEKGRRAFYYSSDFDKLSKEVKEMERNNIKPHALTKDEEENIILWSIWQLKGVFEMREIQKIEESIDDSEEDEDSEGGENDGGEKTYEIKYIIPEELLDFVEQKLSIKIINEFRGKYKTRKYVRYDYGLGRERLAIGSVIASTAPIKDIPMHTLGTIINSFGKEEGDKKKKHFTYTINFVGHGVVEGLSRGLISPIRYKDQDFLTDIVSYRKCYSEVVEEIKTGRGKK